MVTVNGINGGVFFADPEPIKASHAYLQNTIGFSNRRIAEYPFCLRVPVLAIRTRHEFLKRLKRDKYEPEMPDSVSIGLLLHSSDKEFCNRAAKTFLVVYNNFLRKS